MKRWKWLGILVLVVILVSFGAYVWAGVGAEIGRINKFKLSENFYLSDFESPDTHVVKIHPLLVGICEDLFAVQPFVITSGYRTPIWNQEVNGAPRSYHTRGLAVDLQPIFLGERSMKTALILLLVYASEHPEIGAIGLYRDHIHIDLRSERSGSWYSGERKLYWVKLGEVPHWGYYYYRDYGVMDKSKDAMERALAHFKRDY